MDPRPALVASGGPQWPALSGQLAAFAGVAVVLIVTPGPDTALTIRNTLVRGRRAGVATGAGVASGQALWAVMTAVGLVTILRASQPVLVAIRLAGVCYLIYLGIGALLAAGRRGSDTEVVNTASWPRNGVGSAYRQGLLSNLSNPKMVVFFVSLLPQFDPHGSLVGTLGLGVIFASMTLTWLTAYAVVIARVGNVLDRRSLRRFTEGLTGVTLVGIGVRLAFQQR